MKIRWATPADSSAIAQILVASWKSAYKEIVPEDHLSNLSVDERKVTWDGIIAQLSETKQCFYVVELNEQVIGMVSGGPSRNADLDFDGELYAIYANPEFFDQGIGKPLIAKCMDYFAQEGFKSFYCWVFKDNQRGRDFYERSGGIIVEGQQQSGKIENAEIVEVMYGWKELPSIS